MSSVADRLARSAAWWSVRYSYASVTYADGSNLLDHSIVGQDVKATSYYPPLTTPDVHTVGVEAAEGKQPWILVNSTPATCAQIGISHFFQDRGPIELVVSGPNYGR